MLPAGIFASRGPRRSLTFTLTFSTALRGLSTIWKLSRSFRAALRRMSGRAPPAGSGRSRLILRHDSHHQRPTAALAALVIIQP